ncbi:MAG TPA: efflux RND transporter periplasmic adaptor subunit [Candidatus Coprenecus avistercoris]|uniref:Efflux RND transporter periplasmic adaptor subunit n=1 Tax=Candidatus Coprenecus avistercoris TaxID=2840730 RepID=A0A9D1J6X8_9BACT|nr:efflux RND transporter periplasmic adaptor subunit [Candidatus Coprenecus avistercoris]
MKKKKNKALRNILAAVAVILAAAIIYAVLGQENGEPVTVAVPSTGTIVERIPANGKIHPVTEVKISPDVSGEIIELNVEEGDRVSRGDLVIKIKQDVYISLRDRAAATLNATRAQYQQQKASFTQAEQNYMRNKQLYGQKAISLQEFQASTAEYEMAREQLNAAEYNIESAVASLDEAEENLTKTVIYSPIDGIVSSLSVEKGERVVGTSQMAGTEMLRIADFDMMEVLVDVNENDIIRITKGDTADIEVDAYPGRTFKGVVTQIANSAKNLGSTTAALTDVTNFEVKVRILRESYADLLTSDPIPFRPGMSASVEIETERKDGVTKIPLQAVTPDGCVFVLDRQSLTVRKVAVTTGIQDIGNIEVISGLGAADTVEIVTGPYSTISRILEDGMEVRPQTDNDYTKDNEQ